VMAGVDLVTVMKQGGWSDLKMVQRYSHLSPDHEAEAMESIVKKSPNRIPNSATSGDIVQLAERRATV